MSNGFRRVVVAKCRVGLIGLEDGDACLPMQTWVAMEMAQRLGTPQTDGQDEKLMVKVE